LCGLIAIIVIFSMSLEAQENDNLFLYIPSNEIMSNYLNLHSYLSAWDKNNVSVENELLSYFFINYLGKDTIQSLLFESFLRFTKNKKIQNQILDYISINNINTNFTENLKKLYAAVPITRQSNGKDTIQYNFNNIEFDENINLFLFKEQYTFNNEIGLLLFENNWNNISFDNNANKNIDAFFLMFGGGTNALTIAFRRYANVSKNELESIYNALAYKNRYNDKWKVTPLPLEGILERAGADKITIAHGLGPDIIDTIETGTFNIYLYREETNVLYEVSYFMNFSPININFSERNRIFNLLFFQTLFTFLK